MPPHWSQAGPSSRSGLIFAGTTGGVSVRADVAELVDEHLKRHAVLEADRDRGRECVHQALDRRALLADVGEEDLADRAVRILAGGDVALLHPDSELVRDRLALLRHPGPLRLGRRALERSGLG